MFSLPFYALHWYLLLFLQKMESHFMSYTVDYTDLDENCRSEDIKIVFFKLKEWKKKIINNNNNNNAWAANNQMRGRLMRGWVTPHCHVCEGVNQYGR